MFIVSIDKNNVKMAEKEMVTSGSVNAYECQFVFSDEWDKMTKTVTFKAGEKTISVTLDEENKCVIPWEVLSVADVDLYVGVIGAAGAETEDPTDDVVMPTVWGHMGTVRHGTTEGENTEIPTPSAYERIMIEINTIKNDIKDINNTFDGGEVGQVWTKTENGEGWADGGAASAPSIGDNGNWYIGDTDTGVKAAGTDGINGEDGQDGFSPTVDVTTIEGGHTVTITDKNGDQAFNVMNGNDGSAGADGADGFSPTVAITEINNGHKVTITDKDGEKSFDVMNGTDGNDGATGATGADGFSPTVAIAEIEGGHTVTITDATGSHSANIMNGKDGNDGSAGADGADGFSPIVEVESIEGGHTVTITDKDGTKSFDVTNGANGADGIDGANGADGKDGADGFSPIVSVENIDNGHKVTITDKDGAKSFDVMNGADGSAGANGADGKAATIRIGTVTEGDTPAVTNSGTDTDAVFDFVLPGASGGAEYSIKTLIPRNGAEYIRGYKLTKDGTPIGSEILIPSTTRQYIDSPNDFHYVIIHPTVGGTLAIYRENSQTFGDPIAGSISLVNTELIFDVSGRNVSTDLVCFTDYNIYQTMPSASANVKINISNMSSTAFHSIELSTDIELAYTRIARGFSVSRKLFMLSIRDHNATITITDRTSKKYQSDSMLLIGNVYLKSNAYGTHNLSFTLSPFLTNGDKQATLSDGSYFLYQLS